MFLLNSFKKLCLLLILLFPILPTAIFGQDPQSQNNNQNKKEDEIVRISSDLVQAGVAVFDKKGQFVDKLKLEDFQLRVDGKPTAISFFELISSESDDRKINPKQRIDNKTDEKNVVPTMKKQGRIVVFVVDDLHLSADSTKRTRDLILKFIDSGIEQNDLVAIFSTSGKTGFVQQFTNNKIFLRAAVERIIFTKDLNAGDRIRPPMSEFEAQLIDRDDNEVTRIFVEAVLKENPGLPLDEEAVKEQIRGRARLILSQASLVSKNTYSALEQIIRQTAQMSGRKLVFFLSNGFVLDATNTDSLPRLRQITDAAIRANAVIYSIDTKGLDADLPDQTTNSYRVKAGERFESLDGLNILAKNTGGRLIKNTNDLSSGVTKALAETSLYYLIAWQPDEQNQGTEKFKRIEVSIKGRADLSVNVQSGYIDQKTKIPASTNKITVAETKTIVPENKNAVQATLPTLESQLRGAFGDVQPEKSLPTSLVANFLDTENEGTMMSAAVQIESDVLEFTQAADKSIAEVDLVGFLFDAKGKQVGNFKERLTFNINTADLSKSDRSDIFYHLQNKLKPGLYQVGVAARDVKSGRVGRAVQSIEIPDLTTNRLTLSSLFIGEQGNNSQQRGVSAGTSIAGVQISVDRRFDRSSNLRYLIFIYNAARAKTEQEAPDLTIQTQILRGNSVVIASQPREITVDDEEDDLTRLPYAAEISLNTLPVGRYELQVTVQDRIAKTNATQRISFEIK